MYPESGTINYNYDNNGNLISKIDPRGITTTYAYDGLNRVYQRSYSGESGYTTPSVSYFYDNVSNAKGKLTKVSSSVSTTEYTSFDILGRVTGHKQTTNDQQFTTGYVYNLSGALIEQTYPTGRVVKNVLDNNGDLAIVQSRKNLNTGYWNYADSFSYSAAGAVTSMQLGNGRWESTEFNSRLQPKKIALGTTQNATNLLKLDYSYGTTQNNGNILSQTITVPDAACNPMMVCETTAFTVMQNYSYDSLNRISGAVESYDLGGEAWRQMFLYDRYGNRRFDQANTTMPASFANPAVTNPTINPNSNQITSAGWSYDSSGNTFSDAGGMSYIYDSENKQVEVRNSSNAVVGQYFYDGDGKRVKKVVPNGETTVFVYDAAGKQIAEYSNIVASVEDAKVNYLTNDHLGSPRINTDRDGNVTSRHDYHPFGEEIITSQREGHSDYAGDEVRKQFTGYERDDETNLDFAQARMSNFSLGRFTSPDPLASSASAGQPQSWNRYPYTLNNPLRFVDPTGMSPGDYYNLDGNKIGSDGEDDKKIHIVYDKKKAEEIWKTKGRYTAQVDSKITLPNSAVVSAIGDAVERSDKSKFTGQLGEGAEASGGFRESAVTWKTTDGKTEITASQEGPETDPRKGEPASVQTSSDVDGKAHVHPSGKIVTTTTTGKPCPLGASCTGGGTKISTAGFDNKPSEKLRDGTPGDIPKANPNGVNIVVGAGNRQVYFYNRNGIYAEMKLGNFLKIGGK